VKILITGSSGYIGSCLYETIKNKYNVFTIDKEAFNTNNHFKLDLNKSKKVLHNLKNKKIDIIVHLAGQSTIDNINKKKSYILNNTVSTKKLVHVASILNINKIIFASTAAVYKSSNRLLSEKSKIEPKNIYSSTKMKCENIIKKEFSKKNKSYLIFRFFNVCGSLYEFKTGEMHEPETHLIPLLIKKILRGEKFKIYGSDYKTKDGTCIRDYIHIKDLCNAHLKAIKYMKRKNLKEVLNIGSSKGYSVLQVIHQALRIIKNPKFYYQYTNKRRGDLPFLVCSIKKVTNILKWRPRNSSLKKILMSEIKWQKYLINKKKINLKSIY